MVIFASAPMRMRPLTAIGRRAIPSRTTVRSVTPTRPDGPYAPSRCQPGARGCAPTSRPSTRPFAAHGQATGRRMPGRGRGRAPKPRDRRAKRRGPSPPIAGLPRQGSRPPSRRRRHRQSRRRAPRAAARGDPAPHRVRRHGAPFRSAVARPREQLRNVPASQVQPALLPSAVLGHRSLQGGGHLRLDDRIGHIPHQYAVVQELHLELDVLGQVAGPGTCAQQVGRERHPVSVQPAGRSQRVPGRADADDAGRRVPRRRPAPADEPGSRTRYWP